MKKLQLKKEIVQDLDILNTWADALSFFSEEDPLGVIGSFLIDKLEKPSDSFRFKHHYMLHALDSDVLCDLLAAIDEKRAAELTVRSLRSGRDYQRTVCPLKIYVSTQSGRQYLLGYHYRGRHLSFFRLDAIKKVTIGNVEKHYSKYLGYQEKFDQHLWGVSTGPDHNLDHIEMTVHFDPGEEFVLHRLEREERRLKALAEKRVLTDPLAFVQDRRLQLDYMQDKMTSAARTHWDREARRFAGTVAKLDALSPLKVLGRGYAMARTEDGGILRSSDQVQPGDRIRLRLAQGSLGCRVEEKEDNHGEKEL